MSQSDFIVENGKLVMCRGNEEHVIVPDSVTSIDEYAFHDCENLKSVTIPDSVTSIGKYAFLRCKSLESITISNSVTSIGIGVFKNCKSLKNITIPDSVAEIDEDAFWGCESLENVTIPDSVKYIDSNAFSYCSKLNNVELPFSCKIYRSSFPVKCSIVQRNRENNILTNRVKLEIALDVDENTAISQMAKEKGISFDDELKDILYENLKRHIRLWEKEKDRKSHTRKWESENFDNKNTLDDWGIGVHVDVDEELDLTGQEKGRS